MNGTELKFRAHSVNALMAGQRGLTKNQAERLEYLESREGWFERGEDDPTTEKKARKLTPKMYEEIEELKAKRDAPFELTKGAKSYVEKMWRRINYGYKEPVVTDILLKGQLCEEDTIEIVEGIYKLDEFRMKNEENFEDEFFTGTPDLVFDNVDLVEDVKAPWSLKTFIEKEELEPVYYCQVQVYMHLTGKKNAAVHYCLVDTPEELVGREKQRFFWKFGGDEDNAEFVEICDQIDRNHIVSSIPAKDRIKTFCVEYDPKFMEELISRVKLAREYYKTIKLVPEENAIAADNFYSKFVKPF